MRRGRRQRAPGSAAAEASVTAPPAVGQERPKKKKRTTSSSSAAAAALLLTLLVGSAAAAKPGPAATFGVPAAAAVAGALPSNTCAARTLISPAPQQNGLFGYATSIQAQSVIVSAPGEWNPSTGQRRAYLGLRATPRPPSGCVFSSYFALAPVPSPADDEFVQLSVFGATGSATIGQRTFFLGSQVDSAYWCDYFKACGAKQQASAKVASAAAAPPPPDPLLAQALAKAAAPASAALAAKAGVAHSGSNNAVPRLIGRASPQLSGRPVSVLSALAAARAEAGTAPTLGERLRAFMAGSTASDRLRRGEATAPLLRAAGAAARSGALSSSAAGAATAFAEQQQQQRGAAALFAPLVANVSLAGQRLVAASSAAASSSSALTSIRDGDGNGLRSAPPKLSLTGAAAPAVPSLSADRPRLSGAPGPLAAAAGAAGGPLAAARSSNNATAAAAAAANNGLALTPTLYGEVAVFYRLIAQGSPAQGTISNVKRTQVQGPFSLPVSYDLVSDDDVNAFFKELFPNADPSTFFFFLGSTNPWISASTDGSVAVFNDLRMYGATGYDSLLYDGSLQVFSRQGTTNAYKMTDLIYSPYPSDQVPMVFPLFSAMSADGLTLVATGWAYDEGQYGTDVVFVFGRASTSSRFDLRQELYYDSLTEAVTSVGLSPDGLALAVATTTFQPLDGTGALSFEEVLSNVAVARTYGRTALTQDFAARCRLGNLLPDQSEWDTELAPTDNAGRVQAVKLAPILGKKPRRGPTPTIGYRLLASVLGAPAEVYDYDARIGAACPSIPVQRIGAPLGVPGAIDAFGDLAGSAMSADGRTAGVGSQYASEASFPQQSGAAYYYGLVPLSTRF
jgi:hypothetical protein